MPYLEVFEELKNITIQLSDEEYRDYVERGKSMYNKRMKRKITDEEYARWVYIMDSLQKIFLWYGAASLLFIIL